MELIDTHCHLYSKDFKEDLESVVDNARKAGVSGIYLPNIDRQSIGPLMELEIRYPDYCMGMMGLHPCSVKEDFEVELKEVEKWLGERKFSAIGETGLDFYWDTSFTEQQFVSFERQLNWAKELSLPIVIHCRKSMDETIAKVRASQDGRLTGIFHCFTGSSEQAREIMDLGFYLGIGGVVSFKNGGLEPVLKQAGFERLVLETDAPYLAPVPFRGKRNEPSYLKHILAKLALFTEQSELEVARVTTANARKLFGTAG